jgi:hypothetical protein
MRDERDDAVERVLHGLRLQAPLEGMEQRVLVRLRARSAGLSSRRGFFARPRWVWTAACAAGMVAAGIWWVPQARRIAGPERAQVSALPMAAPDSAARAAWPVLLPDASPRGMTVGRLRGQLPRRAASRREIARMVSYSSPPAPLTMQEKLLLQVAEHPTPGEIAMLDPVMREKQEAAEDAQFEKFVAQADPR